MILEFIARIFTTIIDIFEAIPFSSATWIVIGVLTFFVWLFAKANKDPNSSISWEHLITDSSNNRTSPYKLGYLIGVIVSTWLVIFLANKEGGNLSFDIFASYLAFLLGGAGWNSYVKNRDVHYTNENTFSQRRDDVDRDLRDNDVKPPRM